MDIAIHTSDRLSFRTCRTRWDWLSDLRQGYKPIDTPTPLSFGTAIHAGMQTYYDPATWALVLSSRRWAVVEASLGSFEASMASNKKRFLRLVGREALDPPQEQEYRELLDLGLGMLRHYFEYVESKNLDRFTPIAVEESFRVPLFSEEEQNDLFPHLVGHTIVYKGRIDLVVLDEWNKVWIFDHKTTARMRDNMDFLELDDQMGSYNWGYQATHPEVVVAGNIYSEVYKDYPRPPAENKTVRLGRRFSVAKQSMATSYDLYLKTITEAGEDIMLYEDMLHWLKNFGTQYVRRTQVMRSQEQLRLLHERIRLEVQDMLDPDLRIYPSPGVFKCDNCPMRHPCLAQSDGQDVQWILNTNYTKEKRTNA